MTDTALLFDPYAPETLENPARGYEPLLHGDPVKHYEHDGARFVAVGRYDVVKAVASDYQTWSNRWGPCPKDLPTENTGLNSDPPLHGEWRRIFAAQLGPAQVDALAAGFEELANSLVDRMLEKGSGDLHDDFTVPLVVQTMARMIGLPPAEYLTYKRCADASLALTFNTLDLAAAHEANKEIFAIIIGEVERRRQMLRDAGVTEPSRDHLGTVIPRDIISTLVVGQWQGRAMTDDELLYAAHALFVGGAETSSSLILCAMYRLLEDRSKWDYVRANPDSIRAVVEETLRFDPPALALFRKSVKPASIGGEMLPAGTRIMFSMVAANRDPSVFSDPDEFKVTRSLEELRNHLSFSTGPHACVGAALGRMEARIGLKVLAERLPNIRRTGPAKRLGVFNYWGYSSFPAAW